jgi:hypothetical protein
MTVTDICNKALSHLGESRIVDIAERTVAAEKCRDVYDLERDALLRVHRWNFARDRATLSALSAAPAFGWAFQYTLPADCLRVLELNDSTDDTAYSIEGRNLLTNATTAKIVFTRRILDPNQYDVLFVQALALKMAAALAKTIINSTEEKGALLQEFSRVMSEAGWVDAVESKPKVIDPLKGSRSLKARITAYT